MVACAAGEDVLPDPARNGATISIIGDVCTLQPSPIASRLKLVFAVDTSSSAARTDPLGQRQDAIEALLRRYEDWPHLEVAVLSFNDRPMALTTSPPSGFGGATPQAFTRDKTQIERALTQLNVAEGPSDLQAGLQAIQAVLTQDMNAQPEDLRANTRYIVFVLSDNNPEPVCCGAQSAAAGTCDRSANLPICADPSSGRQTPDDLPYLVAGEDYNQPGQLLEITESLSTFASTRGIGSLQLHLALLFNLSAGEQTGPCLSFEGQPFSCVDRARALFPSLAQNAGGQWAEFASPGDVDLTLFPLPEPIFPELTNLIATNLQLLPWSEGGVLDTDGDGLSDETERMMGTMPDLADSDGDLLKDPFDRPQAVCAPEERIDVDGDGLLNCEERILGTSPLHFDSDNDSTPDHLELRFRLDPNSGGVVDRDMDNTPDQEEVWYHTDPFTPDEREMGYRYDFQELGVNGLGEGCYRLEVENLKLVKGIENRIHVYALERIGRELQQWQKACLITPADIEDGAHVIVRRTIFKDPRLYDELKDCTPAELAR